MNGDARSSVYGLNGFQIHLLDYDEDEGGEITFTVFKHPKEIWSLTPCPVKSNLLFTCSKSSSTSTSLSTATLFRMTGGQDEEEQGPLVTANGTLEELGSLPFSSSAAASTGYSSVLWDPSDAKRVVGLGVNGSSFGVFSVATSEFATTSITQSGKLQDLLSTGTYDANSRIEKGVWNPHNTDQIAIAMGRNVVGWDLRSNSSTFVLEEAHNVSIKDVDYNPNKPYNLATGGDDCVVRFWDVRSISSGVPGGGHYSSGAGSRNTSAHNISSASSANNELLKPLKEVCNHSYWVTGVAFNKFHDQLILTSSADCQVNLQSVISISSVPIHNHQSPAVPRINHIKQFSEQSGSEGHAKGSSEGTEQSGSGMTIEDEVADDDDDIYGETSGKPTDGLVSSYDYHEDSVYSVCWSNADPWIFASLSFDGRVVINQVPREHKYKIIL